MFKRKGEEKADPGSSPITGPFVGTVVQFCSDSHETSLTMYLFSFVCYDRFLSYLSAFYDIHELNSS